jgi:hypothetical protein
MKLQVFLSTCGNPDRHQDPGRPFYGAPTPAWVDVLSFTDASRCCREFIDGNGLGAGNWAGGDVRNKETGEVIAHVSYNGRVWRGPQPWQPGITKEIVL